MNVLSQTIESTNSTNSLLKKKIVIHIITCHGWINDKNSLFITASVDTKKNEQMSFFLKMCEYLKWVFIDEKSEADGFIEIESEYFAIYIDDDIS